ncbi:MAG TPA: VWA domain-containing protein [Pseudomonadota bacterium]|nr:VWA domain-containing protein [Pseudomonadota bacterium]
MADYAIEVVFSFDTTGSMYPCLTQVRRKIKETVSRLMRDVPNMRIGIIAHGDYCDKGSTYVTKAFNLSDNANAICSFVQNVEATGGGDLPECYELVLHEAQSLSWLPHTRKCLVMIGDDVPHGPADNPQKLNWRTEIDKLAGMKIPVYGVQCLGRKHATKFYEELAHKSGGFHVTLDQFSFVTDLVMAVCYQQASPEHLQKYEQEVIKEGRMNRGLNKMFDQMMKRAPSATFTPADLRAVPPGRFQILDVDRDCSIRDFVTENGLAFKKGRGFYEFTKTETIQGYKEVILSDRKSGDMFAGAAARELLGLPAEGEGTARIKPTSLDKYRVFVQSTSVNRKLIGGTKFLYEVDDWAE